MEVLWQLTGHYTLYQQANCRDLKDKFGFIQGSDWKDR